MSLDIKKFVNSALLDKKVIKGLGSLAGQIGYGAFSGDLNSGVGAGINRIGNTIGSVLPGKTGTIVSLGSGLVGGAINSLIGTKWNQLNIENVENETARMNNLVADANSLDALQDTIATTAGMSNFSDSYIGEGGLFAKGKVRDKANKLRDNLLLAFDRLNLTLDTNALNIMQDTIGNLEANYIAFGGPLYHADGGPIDKEEINPGLDAMVKARLALDSHFGNPTARRMTNYDTRSYIFTGQEKNIDGTLASPKGTKGNVYVGSWDNLVTPQIQDVDGELKFIEDPWSDENRERSKAQSMKFESPRDAEYFAKNYKRFAPMMSLYSKGGMILNAKKLHHSFGGELNTQGGNFTNGLLYIDNGGSHEENPYEGVPMGVDNQGTPNLVEEGETVFNGYVFSKRLKVPKSLRKKYKLRDNITFADASKKLGKESEERPNDPISKRGLEALMSDLASAQEAVRETQQVRQYAQGGRLFEIGGDKGNQVLNYNNSTTGLYFGKDPSEFNPYASDGTINWNIMYGADSPYTKRRQYVIDHWDDPGVQEWLGRYVEGINEYNKGRSGYQPMTKSDITKDIFTSRTWDKSWGGMHAGVDYAGDPERRIIEQHMLRSLEGDPTAMPETDIYYPNTKGGYTWADRFSDKYTRANNGAYEETTDGEGNIVRTYYYDPVLKKGSGNRYYKKNSNGQYELVTGENPYLDIQNAGNYNQVRSVANNQSGTDYYYDPEEKDPEYKELPTDIRYAPAVGLGIAALTDALGLTNKPDYGNADAVLLAARSAGIYKPVSFNPIGNYLTYNPFDRNLYLNKLSAQAGASRRALLQNAGMNRGAATAALLAADYNNLNLVGELAKQAEEYNLKQRQQVEQFNRETNSANSSGMLLADIANQKALMDSIESSLKGIMTAAEMRERARLTSEQAKSSNLSGFITSLGDIGKENMGWNWRNFGLSTGSFGNVGDEEYLLTHTGKKRGNKGSKGGKIKEEKV